MQKITIIKYLLHEKGGIEKRFQNYLKEFLNRNFQVTVLYGSEKSNYQRVQKVNYIKVNVGIVPSRSLRKIFFSKKVDAILSKKDFKNQITLSMGRTGKADIVIAAGNYPETDCREIENSNWFNSPMYFLDKESFSKSKLILAASSQVKEEIQDLFSIPDRKVSVLYPPVKSDEFVSLSKSEKHKIQEKYNVDPEKYNFLFVSTGHKRKGLFFLLDIFSKLDENKYQLYVAGDYFKTQLRNVKCLGYQKNTNELYNMVDCLLHPASYEAFGQVITESLLCGTPVFVSDRVGAKEIIKNGMGKIIPFGDPDRWINEINGLQKHGNLIESKEIGEELDIKKHISKMLFNWENYQN